MNNTAEIVTEVNKQPTKVNLITKYMLETFKEMFSSLTQLEFKFAVSGIVSALILFLISLTREQLHVCRF